MVEPAAQTVELRRPKRVVTVHYTDYAPPAPGRLVWQSMYPPSADAALRAMLERLTLPPGAIQAKALLSGDVAILTRMPAEAPAELDPGKVRPVAFISEGLSAEEIAAALDRLMRKGWRPVTPCPWREAA